MNRIVGWFAPFIALAEELKDRFRPAPPSAQRAYIPLPNGEVEPPWVAYPEFGPGDPFWRQTGEPFMVLAWEPYYESLNQDEKDAYLKRWQIPEEWWKFHLSPEWRALLESTDED